MLKETSRVGYVKTTDYMGHSHNLIGIVMVLAFLLPLSKSTRNRAVCQGINLDSRSPWSGPFSGQGRRFAQSRARGSHLPGRLYRITETRRSSCYQGVDCPLSTARLSWLEGANRQRASACFFPLTMLMWNWPPPLSRRSCTTRHCSTINCAPAGISRASGRSSPGSLR